MRGNNLGFAPLVPPCFYLVIGLDLGYRRHRDDVLGKHLVLLLSWLMEVLDRCYLGGCLRREHRQQFLQGQFALGDLKEVGAEEDELLRFIELLREHAGNIFMRLLLG